MTTNRKQKLARIGLGAMLVFAGISHLTWARKEFQAQVPPWVPIDKDLTVLLSGLAEIGLGLSLILVNKQKNAVGLAAATFFTLIFPGNIAQYVHHRDAFGLNTDSARFIRLFFQPALILWALWGGGILNKTLRP